ncbi:Hypothetical protein CINCED_3A009518 [Cinara cedri]|uniref:Uncharacterized protein n=1 Tax=Cinara cedri TaxID=506608 RepID=A0A5E4NBL0_9HEMI|nr:Hypothetical protein CINCED_3A009518 [Cinara cedri]
MVSTVELPWQFSDIIKTNNSSISNYDKNQKDMVILLCMITWPNMGFTAILEYRSLHDNHDDLLIKKKRSMLYIILH